MSTTSHLDHYCDHPQYFFSNNPNNPNPNKKNCPSSAILNKQPISLWDSWTSDRVESWVESVILLQAAAPLTDGPPRRGEGLQPPRLRHPSRLISEWLLRVSPSDCEDGDQGQTPPLLMMASSRDSSPSTAHERLAAAADFTVITITPPYLCAAAGSQSPLAVSRFLSRLIRDESAHRWFLQRHH